MSQRLVNSTLSVTLSVVFAFSLTACQPGEELIEPPAQQAPAGSQPVATPKPNSKATVTFTGTLKFTDRTGRGKDALSYRVGEPKFWTVEIDPAKTPDAAKDAIVTNNQILLEISDEAVKKSLEGLKDKMVTVTGTVKAKDTREYKPSGPVQAPISRNPKTGKEELERPGSAARIMVSSIAAK